MTTEPDNADANEALLRQRWRRHSDAWIDAVRARRIPSRVAVTDQALVDAILDYRPDTLLDLGCVEEPPPWYFRTLESWVRLFGAHGLRLLETREPRTPATGQPASVIFIAAAL